MIVCHCNVVRCDDVRNAVDEGARTLSQVCSATGAGRGCGACVFTLRRLLCEHQADAAATAAAALSESTVEVDVAAS